MEQSVGDTDSALIERSLATPEAFGEIYERHSTQVAAFVLRGLNSDVRANAEDIIAEIFVTAFRQRRRYDLTQPNSLPWLYGIARNVLRNQYRWWHRHRRRAISLSPDYDHPDIADRVVERADAENLLASLGTSLDGLNDRERLILELVAAGHSYREIADQLGCGVGTVKSRLSRARTKIRSYHDDS